MQLHSVRVEFEGMIYSRLAPVSATMFTSFRLSPTGLEKYKNLLRRPFIDNWLRVFPGVMKDGVLNNMKNYYMDERAVFQLDICASLSQNTSLGALMKDVVEHEDDVFDFNARGSWKDIQLGTGDVVMFEFCEDITKLPTKVFQVERALQLREICITEMPVPKAVGVVFNGERSKFHDVVNDLTKSNWEQHLPAPKVFDLPMFLIYSSYINIFGEVRTVSDQVRTVSGKLDHVSGRVDEVSGKLDTEMREMRSLLHLQFNKSELAGICRRKGIQVHKKATVDDLIGLLTRPTS